MFDRSETWSDAGAIHPGSTGPIARGEPESGGVLARAATDAEVDRVLRDLLNTHGKGIAPEGWDAAREGLRSLLELASSVGFEDAGDAAAFAACAVRLGQGPALADPHVQDVYMTLMHPSQPVGRRLDRARRMVERIAGGESRGPRIPTASEVPGAVAGVETEAKAARPEPAGGGAIPDPAPKPRHANPRSRLRIGAEIDSHDNLTLREGQHAEAGRVLVVAFAINDLEARDRIIEECDAIRALRLPCTERLLDVEADADGVRLAVQQPAQASAAGIVEAAQAGDHAAWSEGVQRAIHVQNVAHGVWPELLRAMEDSERGIALAASLWTADIADAVAALHEAGRTHGRLSPEALRLARDGRLVLAIEGLIEPRGDGSKRRLDPPRMAPEWLTAAARSEGLTLASRREADVWLLGALLHELLTGRSVYASAGVEPWRALATKDPVLATDRTAALSPELAAVVRSALSRDPEKRPRSARAMARSLRAAVGKRG